MSRVPCPRCQQWEQVTADDFGLMVNCHSCGAIFPVIEIVESPEAVHQRETEDGARRLLRRPARVLVTLGIISLLASCVFGAGYFILGVSEFRVLRGNNGNANTFMLLGVATALLGSLYSMLILIGAGRMNDPRQRGWPIASAILATASVLFCWPIPILNLVLCRYGILALQRLSHPDVKNIVHADRDRTIPFGSISLEDMNRDSGRKEARNFSAYFSDDYEPGDSDEREAVIAEAQRRTRVPGMGLMVTGIVGMAIATILGFVVTAHQFNGGKSDAWNATVFLGSFIMFAFLFFLMAAGGRALGRLQNRALSVTAATLGIISIGYCGVWLVISIPGVIFGIWAFTALSSREVKHAMRWKRQDREDRRQLY